MRRQGVVSKDFRIVENCFVIEMKSKEVKKPESDEKDGLIEWKAKENGIDSVKSQVTWKCKD